MGGSPGGYNIDFYTWRDVFSDQIGARIRAERINVFQDNNALVQAMDLSFYTSTGMGTDALSEKMRITSDGNIGIGTVDPKGYRLAVDGNMRLQMLSDGSGVKLESSYTGNHPIVELTQEANDGYLYVRNGLGTNISRLSGYTNSPTYFMSNVGIGTSTPNDKLSVNGKIRAKEIKVENANWPDYVFADDYKLPTLQETEQHIKDKGHLPGIPSAKEVKANGIDLGEMNAKLLQKIEELTLHLIEMDKGHKKEMLILKEEINQLKSKR